MCDVATNNVFINGSDDNDTFDLVPQSAAPIVVSGDAPSMPPGDALQ
jgi:hypothetical protein